METRKSLTNLKTVAGIVLIVLVAAVAKYLQRGDNRTQAVDRFSAIGTLQSIGGAAHIYKKVYENGFPAGLVALAANPGQAQDCDHAQLIDNQLASSGVKGGFIFTYKPRLPLTPPARGCTVPGAPSYTLTADPLDFGNPDVRHFFTDESGVIRFEFGKQAGAGSPEIE